MNNQHDEVPPEYEFAGPEPRFNLSNGLKLLVICVTFVVIITMICTWLARNT